MLFTKDPSYAVEIGTVFGEYEGTFTSAHGQVRADLFRKGNWLEAHVSFPTGLDAGNVSDPYVSDLWKYARERGFGERFRMIMS